MIALMISITVNGYSQTFGIKGGANFANMSFSAAAMGVPSKSITSFHFGPVADFKLQNDLYFNTGLIFSVKGYKINEGGTDISVKYNDLEIPLNLAYRFPINEKSKFLVQAGPYLEYALSGREKLGSQTSSINFKNTNFKRMDYGLGLGAGVEFGNIVAGINYQIGIANLNDDSSGENASAKNKVFQISLAYMFTSKK